MKKAKKTKRKEWIMILAAMVAAILFVCIFLTIERKVLSAYEVQSVVTAKTEIEEGTQITDENLNELFVVTEMKKEYVIDGAVTKIDSLIGQVIESPVHKKEMVSAVDLTDRDSWMEDLSDPVEFTFTASSVAASVGGTVRGGDVIDVGITFQNEEGKAVFESIGREIYVKEAYSDNGTVVSRSDKETVCTMFRVVMEQQEGEVFLERLRAGDEVIVTLPK